MSWTLLLLLSPLLLVIVVFGTVTVVALVQGRPEDIPAIFGHCTSIFGQLIKGLPVVASDEAALGDGDVADNGGKASIEEGAL